jgi:xanthine dehydrogenase accessory factor
MEKNMKTNGIIVVRGGGDIATGIVQKFHRSGFRLLVLETEKPMAIRRSVSLCQAIYSGYTKVEDISCRRINSLAEQDACYARSEVPVLVDPEGKSIAKLKPAALIDAILAKRNMGTQRDMAPVTIGIGPGFCAPQDVSAVIETMRGHDLGRLILKGQALPNTGIPGDAGGKSVMRVVYAPSAGKVLHVRQIGDIVEAGETICKISFGVEAHEESSDSIVTAPFKGLLRGLISEGLEVPKGLKIADIDPRLDVDCNTISDKARCIGGAALEAYLFLSKRNQTCLPKRSFPIY